MNTKLVRLRSGEDIICEFLDEVDGQYVLDKCIVAVPQPGGKIAFAPWSPLAKEGEPFKVDRDFVVYVVDCNEDIRGQYESMFNNIVAPSKKLIL